MKNNKLYGVNYYTNADNGYDNEVLQTIVFVYARSIEEAEVKADDIMIAKEMNIEDLWVLGGIYEVFYRDTFIQDFNPINIFE